MMLLTKKVIIDMFLFMQAPLERSNDDDDVDKPDGVNAFSDDDEECDKNVSITRLCTLYQYYTAVRLRA